MSDAEILARAKAYPFTRPGASVVILGDRLLEVVELDPDDLASSLVRQGDSEIALGDAAGDAGAPLDELAAVRTAVLAFGSNASPDTLRWKFPDHVAVLPLLHGRASGVDVVYSAHMTVYGSIPGTLQASPGTTVEVYVALLTEAQLERMAAWEINATLERLDGLALELERADPPERLAAFISKPFRLSDVVETCRRILGGARPLLGQAAQEPPAPSVQVRDGQDRLLAVGLLVDSDAGGAQIDLDAALGQGQQVVLTVIRSDGPERHQAEVRWVSGDGRRFVHGLRFVK